MGVLGVGVLGSPQASLCSRRWAVKRVTAGGISVLPGWTVISLESANNSRSGGLTSPSVSQLPTRFLHIFTQ